MIVVDASAVVALLNGADAHHADVSSWIAASEEELITTPLIVAEVDYVVARRGGSDAVSAFWSDLHSGAYLVEWWPSAIHDSLIVARQSGDIGLADASLVALGRRAGASGILTFDSRHFGPGLDGGPVRAVP